MPRPRVLWALLLVSLAVNVFAIAYWGAAFTRIRGGFMQPVPMATAYRIADRLPEPASSSLRGRLQALEPEVDRQLSLYSEALSAGAAEITRPEMDPAALKAAIDAARAYRGRIGDLLTEAFVGTVAELPPETRRRLVERFIDPK